MWVVGGGKTAMDTAHALITEYPGREVNLVAGSGTFFSNRDRLFPVGGRRWWSGTLVTGIFMELGRRFDGTNETDVASWLRDTYGTWLTPTAGNYLLGLLSESENKAIATGLNEVIMDHVVDAVDRNGETDLVFRSGSAKTIQPGSWIVNCTGYMLRGDHPYEPYVSDSGAVVSVQPRSATLHLTSYMGYFLTHLLFLDQLREVPPYELDAPDLRKKPNAVFPYTLGSLAMHNLSSGAPVRVPGPRTRSGSGHHPVRQAFEQHSAFCSAVPPHGQSPNSVTTRPSRKVHPWQWQHSLQSGRY